MIKTQKTSAVNTHIDHASLKGVIVYLPELYAMGYGYGGFCRLKSWKMQILKKFKMVFVFYSLKL